MRKKTMVKCRSIERHANILFYPFFLRFFITVRTPFYIVFYNLFQYFYILCEPLASMDWMAFLEKSCPVRMSFYRTTFENCNFRMSFYRTTCENCNFQMSFYRTTCEQDNFFPKMPSSPSRRGVHKVYKNTGKGYKKLYKKGYAQ